MAVDRTATSLTESNRPRGPNFLELVGESNPGTVVEERSDAIGDTLQRALGDREIAWIQGQSCSGCTTSLLQNEHPEFEDLLSQLRQSVSFHTTLMTASGAEAMGELDAPRILIVEGAIPTRIPRAATIGTDDRGEPKPVLDWVVELGERAELVIAAGSCSSFGGLPAAGRHDSRDVGESPTGAKGLQFDGERPGGVFGPDFETGSGLPVINVGGCPVFPDHLLLTLATVLNGHEPALDEYNRPLPLFEPLVHDECDLREDYEQCDFAQDPGGEGCLYDSGCAGVYANCDCSSRLRNDGTAVCRTVGAPCIGCVEPAFWDRFTPFYENRREDDGTSVEATRSIRDTTDGDSSVGGTAAGALVFLAMLPAVVPMAPAAALASLWNRWRDDEPLSW